MAAVTLFTRVSIGFKVCKFALELREKKEWFLLNKCFTFENSIIESQDLWFLGYVITNFFTTFQKRIFIFLQYKIIVFLVTAVAEWNLVPMLEHTI